jgi:hypothetical protein
VSDVAVSDVAVSDDAVSDDEDTGSTVEGVGSVATVADSPAFTAEPSATISGVSGVGVSAVAASAVAASAVGVSTGSVLLASDLGSGDPPEDWSEGVAVESLDIEKCFQLQSEAYYEGRNPGT